MSRRRMLVIAALAVTLTSGLFFVMAAQSPGNDPGDAAVANPQQFRQQAQKTFSDGNFAEAYQMYRRLALSPKEQGQFVQQDLRQSIQCLQQLNRVDEIDALLEQTAEVHDAQWRGLWGVAQNYMDVDHRGFIVAGEFTRGRKRGNQGGKPVSAEERDRVRALQLMMQAWPMARQDDQRAEVSSFLTGLGNMLLGGRGHQEAWRLST